MSIYSLVFGVDIEKLPSNLSIEKQIGMQLFECLGIIISIFLCAFFVYKEKLLLTIGLQIKHRTKDIIMGLLVGFTIMSIGFIILLIFRQITLESINFNTKNILIYFASFVMVSLSEELLFRAMLLKNLIISFNKYVSLIVSSILFALVHLANPNISLLSLFNLFLSGITLGMTVIYTKNLWFSLSLHFSWNFFQSLFGFNVSGQEAYSIFNTTINSSNILNGGEFGFEGSILCSILTTIIILYFMFINKGFLMVSSKKSDI